MRKLPFLLVLSLASASVAHSHEVSVPWSGKPDSEPTVFFLPSLPSPYVHHPLFGGFFQPVVCVESTLLRRLDRGLETFDRDDASPPAATVVAPRFSDYHRAIGYHFTKGLFSRSQVKPLVIGSAATLAVLPFADEISDRIRGKWDTLGKVGNVIGSPVTTAALAGGLLLAVPFTENQKYERFTFSLSQALILDTALVTVLKLSIDRVRPNEEDANSFPSGHTSHVMTIATVAQHEYGKKVGIPLFILTGLVGVARMEQGKHFLDDVIFGATLGYISAKAAIQGSEHFASKRRLTLVPSIGIRQVGADLMITF